jgi:hypothetical protein
VNTTELSELLHTATDGLEPPAGFTGQVLAGGRRRRLRRRLTMAGSAVAVAAVAVAGSIVALDRHDPEVDTAAMLLTRPTQGALAGDRAFVDEVIDIWQSQLTYADEARFRLYDDLRGTPHVLWAGNTPAGRAAVVVQQTYVHKDYWVHDEGMRLVRGLVAIDPEDGKLKLAGTRPPTDNEPEAVTRFTFGRNDRTMLVVDEGEPLYYAVHTTNDTDTDFAHDRYRPNWQRLHPRDGVAVLSDFNEAGQAGYNFFVAYQGDHPPGEIGYNSKLMAGGDSLRGHLDHRDRDPDYRLPIPNFFPWQDKWTVGEPTAGVSTEALTFNAVPRSRWQITAWRPDIVVFIQETMVIGHSSEKDSKGSVLTVATGEIREDGVRIVDSVQHDLVDHGAVLPIRYRIPDGGGWVVANKGKTLAYRTAPDGQWTEAGKDAALLPDNAIQVKVGDKTVTL